MVNKWQAFGEMLRACFVYGTKKVLQKENQNLK